MTDNPRAQGFPVGAPTAEDLHTDDPQNTAECDDYDTGDGGPHSLNAFINLGVDVIMTILNYCPVKTVVNVGLVCTALCATVNTEVLWKSLYSNGFSSYVHYSHLQPAGTWKELYASSHRDCGKSEMTTDDFIKFFWAFYYNKSGEEEFDHRQICKFTLTSDSGGHGIDTMHWSPFPWVYESGNQIRIASFPEFCVRRLPDKRWEIKNPYVRFISLEETEVEEAEADLLFASREQHNAGSIRGRFTYDREEDSDENDDSDAAEGFGMSTGIASVDAGVAGKVRAG